MSYLCEVFGFLDDLSSGNSLVLLRGFHECEVVGEGPDSVLEVLEVEDEVGEEGELGVVLALGDGGEGLLVGVALGEVLEDLGEADLVPVGQVLEVVEEALLLAVALVVVVVLVQCLLDHVVAHGLGLLLQHGLELALVKG